MSPLEIIAGFIVAGGLLTCVVGAVRREKEGLHVGGTAVVAGAVLYLCSLVGG
ncbi:hypothetical protein [Marinobacterium rhizophilum]|uniref:Uncharacterized protein n=1 Tax=Marinobacterium rhizophilum TaxID=420402 RepID=A0ABY5HP37_9GAMM|nr:hypothetical protein [Marinobacterium rhizophilum]UTW12950.1 hypothetical protein KDW95_04550 [Marinobacterium rhizophilum]